MGRRILGLDIGARTVRAVLLDSTYRAWTVAGHAAQPVAEPAPAADPTAGVTAAEPTSLRDRQAAAVRELVAEHGWTFEDAIVALPGASASAHVLTLPFSDPKRIEQTVGYEVEAQIPFDLDAVAWDWQLLGVREGRAELLASVVRRDELAALLAALATAGVDPRVVVPAAPAYSSLHGSASLAGDEGAAEPGIVDVVLDVGPDRTSFSAISGGALEWARTIPLASADLARGPAPLVRELRATMRSWRARFPEQRTLRGVRLAGDAPALPGLAEVVSAELGAPAEPLALTGQAAAAIPEADAPQYALALALALRGHQNRRGERLNLRRGDLAFTRDFQHVRGKVVRLGAWAALIVVLALVSAGVKAYALSQRERLLDRALCDSTEKLLGKCYDDFTVAESVLRGRGTPAAAIPRLSAVDILDELARNAPADVKYRFDRIEITRDKLHLQGTTEAAENVDRIVSGLRNGRCFGDAHSGGVRRRGTETRFEFTIDSNLTCEGAAPVAGKGA
jgi:general secretion pathway protein L